MRRRNELSMMQSTSLLYAHLTHPSGRRLWAQTTRHLSTAGLSAALVAAVPGTRLMLASAGKGLVVALRGGTQDGVPRRHIARGHLRLVWSRR